MKDRSELGRGMTGERRPAAVPEHLVQAAVKAAVAVVRRVPASAAPADADEILDDLGRRLGQFPSVGVPPAFDEPCAKGMDHVIWYAC
jgi:hypothetical protein